MKRMRKRATRHKSDAGSIPFPTRYFMSSPRVQPVHIEVVDRIAFLMAKAMNALPCHAVQCHVFPRQSGCRHRHRHRHRRRHRWLYHRVAITGDDQGRRRKPYQRMPGTKEHGETARQSTKGRGYSWCIRKPPQVSQMRPITWPVPRTHPLDLLAKARPPLRLVPGEVVNSMLRTANGVSIVETVIN